MKRISRFVSICLLTLGTLAWPSSTAEAQYGLTLQMTTLVNPIQKQILGLGSVDSTDREIAIRSLHTEGIRAYDDLCLARSSTDREIAISSRRLLGQIDIQHSLSEACPVLNDYLHLDFTGKAKIILQLGRMGTREARTGLCRVARYEKDEFLSRAAAIELITETVARPSDPASTRGVEISQSNRTAARWIRAFSSSAPGPEDLESVWGPLIDDLLRDVEVNHNHPALTRRLLCWYVDRLLEQNLRATGENVVERMVATCVDNPGEILEVVDWLMQRRFFHQVILLSDCHFETISADARLQYRLAELNLRCGQVVRASEIAARAAELVGPDPLARIQCGIHLEHAGLMSWARIVYQSVLVDQSIEPTVRLQASCLLAELLHNNEQHLEASQILLTVLQHEKEPASESSLVLLTENAAELWARQHYYAATHFIMVQDLVAAKQELLSGLEFAATPDLVIALSSLPDENPNWQADVGRLVQRTLEQAELEVLQLRNEHSRNPSKSALNRYQLAEALNRFAWLSINTSGDLGTAREHAREAVGMSPTSASFLDTLARCEYRLGNWQQAVLVEQQAVAQYPLSRRFHRTLLKYRQAAAFAEIEKIWR